MCLSVAVTPKELTFALEVLISFAFLMQYKREAKGALVSGERALLSANTKSSAVIGVSSCHLAFFLKLNMYVKPFFC